MMTKTKENTNVRIAAPTCAQASLAQQCLLPLSPHDLVQHAGWDRRRLQHASVDVHLFMLCSETTLITSTITKVVIIRGVSTQKNSKFEKCTGPIIGPIIFIIKAAVNRHRITEISTMETIASTQSASRLRSASSGTSTSFWKGGSETEGSN